jgi:hypothetical protein
MCVLTVGLALWFQVLRPRRTRATAAMGPTGGP